MVVALEIVERFVLVGPHHVRHVLLGVDVTDLGLRGLLAQPVPDRLYQMGFTQADAAIYKKRVVCRSGAFRHLGGCGPRELVGLAGNEGIEGKGRVETGHLAAARFRPAILRGRQRRERGGCGAVLLVGEGEQDLDIAFQLFAREQLDAREEFVADPLQYETIRRHQGQPVAVGVETQRLDPGLVLLRWQLLLEAGQTEAPEAVHRRRVGVGIRTLAKESFQHEILSFLGTVIHRNRTQARRFPHARKG
ncbi:hypothetical protein D3C83_04360 [compost metagenome]